MANTLLKYGNGYLATKVLNNEADNLGGVYEVYITLIHEWAGTIVAKTRATRTAAKTYEYQFEDTDIRTNGVFKIKWEYEISDSIYTDYDVITVYTPYVDEMEFFDEYTYLDTANNDFLFDTMEQKVRNVIHAYCGQNFEYYPDVSFSIDGTGGEFLTLPLRIESISSVIASVSDSVGVTSSDETDYIEKTPDSDWHLRWKGKSIVFKSSTTYAVTGEWGWLYVPSNVTQAAKLLIAEQFNQDNDYRNHGVTDLYMDTHRMRIDDKILWSSTGVIDADVLLMDYIRYELGWV